MSAAVFWFFDATLLWCMTFDLYIPVALYFTICYHIWFSDGITALIPMCAAVLARVMNEHFFEFTDKFPAGFLSHCLPMVGIILSKYDSGYNIMFLLISPLLLFLLGGPRKLIRLRSFCLYATLTFHMLFGEDHFVAAVVISVAAVFAYAQVK